MALAQRGSCLRPRYASLLALVTVTFFLSTPNVLAQQNNWSLEGCMAVLPNVPTPPSTPITASTQIIQSCVDTCANQNITYALLSGQTCACLSSDAVIRTLLAVNVAECNLKCDGELPCGNPVSGRYSVYNTGKGFGTGAGTSTSAPLPSSSPAVGSSTPQPPPQANGGTITTSGKVTAPSSRNVATIVASSISAAVVVACLVAFLCYRYRKRRSLHHLPRLEAGTTDGKAGGLIRSASKRSAKALKAGVVPATTTIETLQSGLNGAGIVVKGNGLNAILPRTPNMIYSVITAHNPISSDEIELRTDDVVAVQRHFEDGWGVGTNVSTGQVGVFPLGCLVSEDAWVEKGFALPSRAASAGSTTSLRP
ncbi:hypothetical protein SpCBS45565_g06563 [Spizellomyces sp. 'palustris']|nr:hypothetical protein SpCBS45565_g06563 [Spizellomyces sp. 'palustris']